jgi:hypothetical protein
MKSPTKGRSRMRKLNLLLGLMVIAGLSVTTGLWGGLGLKSVLAAKSPATPAAKGYAGSVSCRECHEKFYQLWSTSRHGLAMQPYTAEFARKELTPQGNEITIGKASYRADISGATGFVRERGAGKEQKYRIEHLLGGKNVYYFLTPLEKGRLQTLPVAYDVHKKEWCDTGNRSPVTVVQEPNWVPSRGTPRASDRSLASSPPTRTSCSR